MLIVVFLLFFCADYAHNAENRSEDQQEMPNEENLLTREKAFDGWIRLFDGKSLYGWKQSTEADWKVVDGAIRVTTGKRGLLRTTTQFDHFILQLQFRAADATNSGVFVRTSPSPRSPASDCYEINIAPRENPFPTGSIVGRKKYGGGIDPTESAWQQMQIHCEAGQVTVKVNGKTTADYRDPNPLGKGYIGLQFNSGTVEFRNIYLKPLRLMSMFNGKSLAGWKASPEMKSRFSVADGELRVIDGPGQLESRSQFANFIMQLKVKTHAPELNSGIFFRCIPGEKMNGYESQIHNGILQGSQTLPKDFGTGGIFRRKPARLVVAKDEEWLVKTIIAEGPHFSTWVNGTQVCDWTDQRKPNINPRRGYRAKKGTIMIQGHDPTTDISFKDIWIRELADRKLGR